MDWTKTIKIISIAKGRQELFIESQKNPIPLKHLPQEIYNLVKYLDDEAHRFAITYHRKLREQSSLETELDYVVGLGEKRKKQLLLKFKTVDYIRQAEVEDIAEIKGFNRVLAE